MTAQMRVLATPLTDRQADEAQSIMDLPDRQQQETNEYCEAVVHCNVIMLCQSADDKVVFVSDRTDSFFWQTPRLKNSRIWSRQVSTSWL